MTSPVTPSALNEAVKWLHGDVDGVEQWNRFRSTHSDVRLDLSGQVLHNLGLDGVDLSNVDLSNADLSYSRLFGAKLTESSLHRANLCYAYLNGADLRDADLSCARLGDAQIQSATLERANLRQADFWEASLDKSNLKNANLERARLEDAYFRGADLSNADLSNCSLKGASFEGAMLSSAVLAGVVCGMTGDMRSCRFQNADLRGASFVGADLSDAQFTCANATWACFANANLQRAYLGGATLTSADLSGADLRDARDFVLDDNDIRGAIFSPRSVDPWSVLQRSYTGLRLTLNVVLFCLFITPYAAKTLLLVTLSDIQSTARMADVGQSTPIVPTAVADGVEVTWSRHLVLSLIMGFDQAWYIGVLACVLAGYNIARYTLTQFVSPLRDEAAVVFRAPHYHAPSRDGVVLTGLNLLWDSVSSLQHSYGWMWRVHRAISVVQWIAWCSVLWHVVAWLTRHVDVPHIAWHK